MDYEPFRGAGRTLECVCKNLSGLREGQSLNVGGNIPEGLDGEGESQLRASIHISLLTEPL